MFIDKIKKFICEHFDHKMEYNFTYLPSKGICKRCKKEWKIDYSGDLIKDGPKFIEIK